MAQDTKSRPGGGPMDRLKSEAVGLVGAMGDRAAAGLRDKVQGATGRLTDYVNGGAGPGLMSAVTGAKDLAEGKGPVRSMLGAGMTAAKEKVRGMFGKGGGGKGKKIKVTNIVETIDLGVPVTLAYNQWTQFADFPSFMKKVETVEQAEDEKLNWKAQVFWSHRSWEATILEQHPDDKIIWRSKGDKGYVDGAVTFHELAPSLTRILLVLEYHPQGFMERTGNIWRAQGRRVRLELKHFRRHVMSEAILHPEEIEGWRGVIEDGEVVQEHEPASSEGDREDREGGPEDQDEFAGEPDDSGEDEQDEYDEYGQARDEADEEPEADIEDDAGEPEDTRRPSRSTRAAASRREPVEGDRVPAPRSRRAATSGRREQQRPQRSTRRAPASGGRSK